MVEKTEAKKALGTSVLSTVCPLEALSKLI